ncbi:hypothetical protein ACFVH6_03560 [Spirillospora sp. NPDC127200]
MTLPVPDPLLITVGVLAAPTAWALWRARRLRRSRPVSYRAIWTVADQRWLQRHDISPVAVMAADVVPEDGGGGRRRRGGTA